MISSPIQELTQSPASAAFDQLAPRYDAVWTNGLIGRLQREQAWQVLGPAFQPGERILELGCGTGSDAARLAGAGIRVHATDVSSAMLDIARRRIDRERLSDRVTFELRAAEQISDLRGEGQFDGAFSNFGVLNCIPDLQPVAAGLGSLLRPGAKLIVCLMGRFCMWESAWYLLHARLGKAFRRLRAGPEGIESSLGSESRVRVYYHSVAELAASFRREFSLIGYRGVGIFVPPSYLESWARGKPSFFRRLSLLDERLARWPTLRGAADHRLAVFLRRGEAPCRH